MEDKSQYKVPGLFVDGCRGWGLRHLVQAYGHLLALVKCKSSQQYADIAPTREIPRRPPLLRHSPRVSQSTA